MASPNDFNLPHPGTIGASEYRAIYDTLADALDGCEDEVVEEPRVFAIAILEEFIGHSVMLLDLLQSGAGLDAAWRKMRAHPDFVEGAFYTREDITSVLFEDEKLGPDDAIPPELVARVTPAIFDRARKALSEHLIGNDYTWGDALRDGVAIPCDRCQESFEFYSDAGEAVRLTGKCTSCGAS